jgi:DNA replication and repair protein RecF
LNLALLEEIRRLGEEWKSADIRYERKTQARTEPELKEEIINLLLATRDRDIILQSTGTGPHREDWQVYRDGRSIPSFASRGQERVAVLALLLLEVSYLELRRNEKPIILLDDAFSELDDVHQGTLLDAFKGYQVLMTSTRVPPNAEGAKVFRVEAGIVHF